MITAFLIFCVFVIFYAMFIRQRIQEYMFIMRMKRYNERKARIETFTLHN